MQDIDHDDLNWTSGADGSTVWTYKPALGIIHPTNCSVCRSYMIHVVVANQSGEASFKSALSDKESRVSSAFLEGVQSGRQIQQEYDAPVLARYKSERDKALQSLEQHQRLLEDATKELDSLRDQVLAMQVAYDELSQENDTGGYPSSPASTNVSSMERLLLSPTGSDWAPGLLYKEEASDHMAGPGDATVAEVAKRSPNMGKLPQVAASSLFPPVTLTFGEIHGQASASCLPPRNGTSPATSKPSTPVSNSLSLQQSPSQTSQTPRSPRPVRTLGQFQALMKAAHAGDEFSLTRVRAFVSASQHTPRPARTELQRYALLNWRNPPPRPMSDPAHLPDGSTFSTEIYVDASAWGIGFVMDGMWLAWKFSDSLVFSGNQIDSSWAEMLAVEVGLWTVVHWVGRMPIEILVRSDNAGVVKAIEKRHANHLSQNDILQRILNMSSEHGIRITMKWISGLENPADNPSRGVPGLGATLLPLVPPIPSYLSEILCPISTLN